MTSFTLAPRAHVRNDNDAHLNPPSLFSCRFHMIDDSDPH
jgi:hypothetical protein